MKIGVLALQGAFAEHEKVLEQLGAECIELRQARDLAEPYDALVLPGGESTVQGYVWDCGEHSHNILFIC